MPSKKISLFIKRLSLTLIGLFAFTSNSVFTDDNILAYTVNTKTQDLQLYWRNDKAQAFKSILNLKTWLENKNKTLVFAMNGGMYKADGTPQGLFIQKQTTLTPLDTTSGKGNFYLKPNGVFYITTDKQAVICPTNNFVNKGTVQYATQSGPMLLVEGNIHAAFKEASTNLNIRNGVGILPDGRVIFAMSKQAINFYNFATYFKNLGCKNALYLDGFVSRCYLPGHNWLQTDGDFGVIIGVTDKKK